MISTLHKVRALLLLDFQEALLPNTFPTPLVRTTRARIIHLRNDHKAVMAKVEQGVHTYFADIRAREARGETSQVPPAAPELTEDMSSGQNQLPETPFAKVNTVADGSPAAQAGMKVGDKVRSFGIVNWMNHENLRKISEVVQNNEGVGVCLIPTDISNTENWLTVSSADTLNCQD